ncbi:Esa1p-associated factor [Exophiala xenobiotica]|nr:Esa1p-associated factor [Exophiala xenobiotica]KAK5398553.1 Esa1p-associated factor [Exophiala xenobiotica]KAK5406496.1 Esa1p-associated factor [Exophiala xenobiotica]KAK5466140.1 Esa1p-associated factor [Exophiala xenobiotica]KAK5484256.1 Esa1p-associated factor [Exophiala xenobiotica]
MDKDNSGKKPGEGQKRKRRDPVLSQETNLDLTPYVPRRAAVQATFRLAAPSRPLFSDDNVRKTQPKAAKQPRATPKGAGRINSTSKKRAAGSRGLGLAAKKSVKSSVKTGNAPGQNTNSPTFATSFWAAFQAEHSKASESDDETIDASDIEDETIKASHSDDETIDASDIEDKTIRASRSDDETIEASDIEHETFNAYNTEAETIKMADPDAEMIEAAEILMGMKYDVGHGPRQFKRTTTTIPSHNSGRYHASCGPASSDTTNSFLPSSTRTAIPSLDCGGYHAASGPSFNGTANSFLPSSTRTAIPSLNSGGYHAARGPSFNDTANSFLPSSTRTAIPSHNSGGYHTPRGPPSNDTANWFLPGRDGGPRNPCQEAQEEITRTISVTPATPRSHPEEQTAAQRARYQEILRSGTRFTPDQLGRLAEELNLTAVDVLMLPPPLDEAAQMPPPPNPWQGPAPFWEPVSEAVRDAVGHYLERELFGTGKPAAKKIWTVIKYPEVTFFPVLDDGARHPNISREYPQEDAFYNRPSIRFTLPDHLKNLLVDDWENVTKSMLLVPLPSSAPANYIFDEYFNAEKKNRLIGSAEADILEEFVAGLKIYFEKTIGKLLLYRFERPQLAEMRKLWESGKYKDWEGKGPGDCYGGEFVGRMLSAVTNLAANMPEIAAQTNLDAEQVARLKAELIKFANWLSRHSDRFFCAKYEKPSAEYIEKAR